jgi:hypothetical protein
MDRNNRRERERERERERLKRECDTSLKPFRTKECHRTIRPCVELDDFRTVSSKPGDQLIRKTIDCISMMVVGCSTTLSCDSDHLEVDCSDRRKSTN